ncbi:MAG TPA: mechanosensitive ion channel domain-containing protein, partial [Chthoniobacteraceae bacterium]
MFLALAPTETLTLCVASVPVIYLAAVALGRYLKRRYRVHLSVVYQFFSIALALWLPLVAYLKLEPLPPQWSWLAPADHFIGAEGQIAAIVALLGSLVLTSLIRRFYWEIWFEKSRKTRAPRFLSDLAALIIFITTALAVLHFIYHRDIAGLALGSTVVAAILGFALQDLLGNIIAGISLELGKPFRTGDWLIIDQQHAEVIEVNWRSTRLRTN